MDSSTKQKTRINILVHQNDDEEEPDWVINWRAIRDKDYTRVDDGLRKEPPLIRIPVIKEDCNFLSESTLRLIGIALKHPKYEQIVTAKYIRRPCLSRGEWLLDEMYKDLDLLGSKARTTEKILDLLFSGQLIQQKNSPKVNRPKLVNVYGLKVKEEAASKIISMVEREKRRKYKEGCIDTANEYKEIVEKRDATIRQLEDEIVMTKLNVTKDEVEPEIKDYETIVMFRDNCMIFVKGSKIGSQKLFAIYRDWVNSSSFYEDLVGSTKKWGTLILDHKIFRRERCRSGMMLCDYAMKKEFNTRI